MTITSWFILGLTYLVCWWISKKVGYSKGWEDGRNYYLPRRKTVVHTAGKNEHGAFTQYVSTSVGIKKTIFDKRPTPQPLTDKQRVEKALIDARYKDFEQRYEGRTPTN